MLLFSVCTTSHPSYISIFLAALLLFLCRCESTPESQASRTDAREVRFRGNARDSSQFFRPLTSTLFATMASTSAIHDPLDIDVRRQIADVVKAVPSSSLFSSHVTKFTTILDNNNGEEIMSMLSRLLAMPALSLLIAKAFRPLLLDLCARWILDDENMDEKLVALNLLLDAHEHLFPCVAILFQTPNSKINLGTQCPAPAPPNAAFSKWSSLKPTG